jgi:hypothetical protein
MQRIRYGLTGLAFVFLMVLLGTAIIQSGDDPQANQAAATLPDQPSEPLAELGVAPGEAADNGVNNQAEPRAR